MTNSKKPRTARVRYVGPAERVYVPVLDLEVDRDEPVEVPAHIAQDLCAQHETWDIVSEQEE